MCFFTLFFQSSAFKLAVELINEDAAKTGSQIKFSMDFKSEVLFNHLMVNWLKVLTKPVWGSD